jgi:hypothetical protein
MAVNPSLWKVAMPEDVAATSPRARGEMRAKIGFSRCFVDRF